MSKIIFHIDMNSFFVSCEVAQNPSLKGKDVAVAPYASNRKSIILAASYSAKAKGVKTTMHINEALRVCPGLIIVESHYRLYEDYSRKFFSYFLTITPLVEPASIDEGFLDVTDACKKEDPIELANRIQKEVYEKLGLPCSIGIAPNKFLAKMASDMKKPLGITVLRKRDVPEKMWPLPVGDLLGVGKKTLPALNSIGIKTIGDLANYKDLQLLTQTVGPNSALAYQRCACGEGSDIVDVNRWSDPQSISNEYTFDADEYDINKVKQTMKVLCNSVSNRLEKKHVLALTFTVKIKYNNFKAYSKSKTIDKPLNDASKMYEIYADLFDDLHDSPLGIRLVGVGASKFKEYHERMHQMSIFDSFDDVEKEETISKIIRNINEEIGKDVVVRGVNSVKKE